MRILIVYPQLVYPAGPGGIARVVEFSRFLSKRHEISILCFVSQVDLHHVSEAEGMKEFCHSIHIVPHRSLSYPLHLWYFLFGRRPSWIYEVSSRGMAAELKRIMESQDIDLVHIEFTFMAQYIRFVDTARCTTVLAELELKSRSLEIDVAYHWPSLLSIRRWYQMIKFRRYEVSIWREFDKILTINSIEKRLFIERDPNLDVDVFPFGVDTDYYRPLDVPEIPNSMAFMGDFWHYPNVDALLWFMKNVFPLVLLRYPSCTLRVIGPNLDKEMDRRLRKHRNVIVTGYVDDLRPTLSQIEVFVNPILTGGGVRTKLLVAMALQRAVVSTTLGLEGIEANDGIHALIGNRPEEFANCVVQLLGSAGMRKTIGENARQMIEDTQAISKIFPNIENMYEELVARKRAEYL